MNHAQNTAHTINHKVWSMAYTVSDIRTVGAHSDYFILCTCRLFIKSIPWIMMAWCKRCVCSTFDWIRTEWNDLFAFYRIISNRTEFPQRESKTNQISIWQRQTGKQVNSQRPNSRHVVHLLFIMLWNWINSTRRPMNHLWFSAFCHRIENSWQHFNTYWLLWKREQFIKFQCKKFTFSPIIMSWNILTILCLEFGSFCFWNLSLILFHKLDSIRSKWI